MGHAKCFLTNSCVALAMRGVFVNFVALLTCNVVGKRWYIRCLIHLTYLNTLYIRLQLAGSCQILTKFMDVCVTGVLLMSILGCTLNRRINCCFRHTRGFWVFGPLQMRWLPWSSLFLCSGIEFWFSWWWIGVLARGMSLSWVMAII